MYEYDSKGVYFARLCIRLRAYAHIHIKKEVHHRLNPYYPRYSFVSVKRLPAYKKINSMNNLIEPTIIIIKGYNRASCLTMWIRFFERIPCIDIAGGRVVFILELHVKSGRLTESISWSYIKKQRSFQHIHPYLISLIISLTTPQSSFTIQVGNLKQSKKLKGW